MLGIEKAASIINDPRSEGMKILVVTNDPANVEKLLPLLNQKELFLNMANYGRIGGALSDKEKITETVYLSPEDKAVVERIFDMGYDFKYQPLPDDTPQSLKQLIGG